MKKLTPAQQQYMDMKRQHPDCVLLFRLGDFYEVFYEDAQIAHKVLGITLTARDKQAEDPIPMAGIPYHALDKYLPLLIHAWYKVALAEQVGEVVPGKLVERKITQIITPWTRVEQWSLAAHLVAVVQYTDHRALAWGDVTLGVWTTRSCQTREELLQAVIRLSPREIICDGSVHELSYIERRAHDHLEAVVSSIPVVQDATGRLRRALHVSSLEGYGEALHESVRQACASLFWYIEHIQQPLCVRRIESRQHHAYVLLDQLTVKNLEIFQGSYQGNKKQSLFGVINTCSTSMWARLLAHLLAHPTQDITTIQASQKSIGHRHEHVTLAREIHQLLSQVSDIPRLMQHITQKKRMISGMRQLAEQISQLHTHPWLFAAMNAKNTPLTQEINSFALDLIRYIDYPVGDENDWVKSWYDTEVDRLRHIDQDVDEKLLTYQQGWFARSGVAVKIKYISNQGYFLEVTPKDIQKFESVFNSSDRSRGAVRAQTLKTGQRYITSYLQELQAEIFNAKENLHAYHRQLAEKLFERWQSLSASLYSYADLIAQIDLSTSMALLMHERDWCLPEITIDSDLHIMWWRHPVVEAYLPREEQFIPNDTLCTKEDFFHLITWPNMGGKSTYMRQQALIVLLSHAGLPVPAKQAHVPLVDGLFARIWSGDVLAKQQSTFMTEMIETAAILHNATSRSFLVIDELGRGTSTRDWLALAKAITVYICQSIQAKTLFATHYHELIALEWVVSGVQNRHVGVYETEHEVVFLKKICRGGADKSYGLDVAKLAWIPSSILDLANEYLAGWADNQTLPSPVVQSSLFAWMSSAETVLLEELRGSYGMIDVHTITPLDALQILQQIIQRLRK
jgi:DNA mismatch repair protein MutS